MNGQYGHMAMVNQFFCMMPFKYSIQQGMLAWDGDKEVNIFVLCKSLDGFVKIAHSDKIKFRIVLTEHLLHDSLFFLIIRRDGNIMGAVNIHNVESRMKELQH